MVVTSSGPEMAQRTVNAFGTTVIVRAHAPLYAEPGYASTMVRRLTSAWSDSPSPVAGQLNPPVIDLGEVRDECFERAHSEMSTEVTLAALKFSAGKLLMFHAGGIARKDGTVIAIIGPSGRGKTTTLQQLGTHYGYVSDETVAIDMEGLVFPYRKPLSVITDGHQEKLQISPSELGLKPLPDVSLQIGGFAVLERAGAGIVASQVTELSFAGGLVVAAEQSSYLHTLDQPLCLVAKVASAVGGFKRLTVGQPDHILGVAEELFHKGARPQWSRLMPATGSVAPSVTPAFLATDVIDAVECEDGTVIFAHDRNVILLDGIGPQLWKAACQGDDWVALVSDIESEFGPAPAQDTRTAIENAAEDLINAGILLTPSIEHVEML